MIYGVRASAVCFLMFFAVTLCAVNAFADSDNEEIYDEEISEPPQEPSEKKFLFEGLYKNLVVMSNDRDGTPGSVPRVLAGSMNRLRLSPEYRPDEFLTIRLDFDTETVFSNYRSSPAFGNMWIPQTYNEPVPGIYEINDRGNPYARMKIHRAYAKYLSGRLTATAGRQQIRFGSGRLWNPLDVLNPVSPAGLESADEQRGVDALRADFYFDELTELTAAWVPRLKDDKFDGSGIDDHNSIVRFKRTAGRIEAAFITGYISKRAAAGIDLSTIIFEGSLRGAVIAFRPESGGTFLCAGTGYEYTFRNGIYFIAEYFYNSSSPGSDPVLLNEYYRAATIGPDQKSSETLSNRFLTWNRHYTGIGAGYDLHPLVRAEAYLISDIEGGSVFISPSLKYSALENLDISLAAMTAAEIRDTEKISDFDAISSSPLIMLSLTAYF